MAVGISAASKTLTIYSTADNSSLRSAARRRITVPGDCFFFSLLSLRPRRICCRRSLSTAFFVLEKSGSSTGDGENSSLRSAARRRITVPGDCFFFSLLSLRPRRICCRRSLSTAFFVLEKSGSSTGDGEIVVANEVDEQKKREEMQISHVRAAERKERKKSERTTYLITAVMSSLGIMAMAVAAVYYRFAWQMEGGEVPITEMFGTFALSVGAAVGMEFWARWAHRALWHASLWHMHESHHRPRDGPFELNDVFAIINAVPAISLLAFGFFNRGLLPGLCFGAGLGITLFGIAYMFVHDGLVHRRFLVGPIANVPYFRKVAAAHQIHHSDKFEGVPYGLFMGPKELEEVGGLEELEKEIARRIKLSNKS